MRKNRKKQSVGMLIILALSIITLNLLGVSYAYWNENLDMAVLTSTGSIKPRFSGDEIKIVGNSKGEITLTPRGNALEITGWCYPTFNENIFVEIGNDGTIPIVYNSIEEIDSDEIIQQIDYTWAEGKEGIKIHIQAENENNIKYENRSFTYQLQFEQGLR